MIDFLSFTFTGDKFYQEETTVPLSQSGLTLLRGKNFDASKDGKASNGTGKTRLIELLASFIYGRGARGTFKKTVSPLFKGTLEFKTKTDHWSFTYEPSKSVSSWQVLKNGQPFKASHKASDVQEFLQKTIGITREEFNYFVFINQQSLNVLIKGKGSERKSYLEGFFNIDTFYSNSFDIYKAEWNKSKVLLETLREDRIRLVSVKDSRKDLPNKGWATTQLDLCDEALPIIKETIQVVTNSQATVRNQIDSWNQYLKLYTSLQGVDVSQLRSEYDSLMKQKIELENKAKMRLQLEAFLRTKYIPHQAKKPVCTKQQPEKPKPETSDITDKGILLNQMQEKLRLKKLLSPLVEEITSLKAQLEGLPSLEELERLKAQLYKDRVDTNEHLKLLKQGGDACPTCKQPLNFILEGLSVEERILRLNNRITEITKKEKEYLTLASLYAKLAKLNEQEATLNDQYSRFPTFGVKLSVAQYEFQILKDLQLEWEKYEKELDAAQQWKNTNSILDVEAKNLGYPDILKEDTSSVLQEISLRLTSLTEELKQFDRFDELTNLVIELPQLAVLEDNEKLYREDMAMLLSRVEALNEFKGVLRTQISSLELLITQEKALEEKLQGQEKAESECKILELIYNFYSPSGFKVYELKKRCQKLIDRANVWSKLFFQEPYVWSMSDDLENLDFFIQPTHDLSTEPYPISLLSAGEYNRAARVLLFSQLELIPPNKKTNLLFLDEIEGNLDEVGMIAFTEVVLPKLKETFQDKTIVVISHQTSLHTSDALDHMWVAERRNRKTKLNVYPEYHRSKVV